MIRTFGTSIGLAAALATAPALAQQGFVPAPTPTADALADQMRTLAANPRDVSALIIAGELSVRLGDVDAATAFFARAEAIDPRSPRLMAARATLLVQQERPGEALRLWDAAERGGVAIAPYLPARGLAWDLVGQPAAAQRDYRRALLLDRDDETLRRLALSLGISGQVNEALTLLDPLVRRGDRAAWRARAFVLAMSGQQAEAERIAAGSVVGGAQMGPFLAMLRTLPAADRAFATHFGSPSSTPTRLADARLAPLPVGVALAATPAPVAAPPAPVRLAEARALPSPVTRATAPFRGVVPGRTPMPSPAPSPAPTPPAPVVAPSAASATPPPPASASVATVTPSSTPSPPPAPPSAPVVSAAPVTTSSATATPSAVTAQTPLPTPALTSIAPSATVPTPPVSGSTAIPATTLPVGAPEPVAASPTAAAPVAVAVAGKPAASTPVAAPAPAAPAVGGWTLAPSPAAPVRSAEVARRNTQLLAAVISGIDVPAAELGVAPPAPRPAAAKPAIKPKPEAKKPAAEPKKPDPAKENPQRWWVQVAGGANEADLGKEWKRVSGKAPAVFRGKSAWTTPLKATNRLLAGPFASQEAAMGFVNALKKEDVAAFAWQSAAGQAIDKLETR